MKRKTIRKLFIALAIVGVVWFMFDVTTPKQCKVPIEQMTQWCKDFRYP
jgi:hypothetical protein